MPILPVIFLFLAGCHKDDDPVPAAPYGMLTFAVNHDVNGAPLVRNDLCYTNAAGNIYMVTGLKYFISDITLYRNDGTRYLISTWKDIFYIDEDIPSTKQIQFFDKIPVGSYDAIGFNFGINEAKNKSFMYVNPPEVVMGWPELLGGGYHYMMLDGKWKDPSGAVLPFNCHLGIGQLYHGSGYNVDSIYAFVQNWFRVSLPGSGFSMSDKDTVRFALTMNIERWFQDPNNYDHNNWGGAIMQNQPAMQMVRENGWDVFSIARISQNH